MFQDCPPTNNWLRGCVRRMRMEMSGWLMWLNGIFDLEMWLNVSEDLLYNFKECWKLIEKSMNGSILLLLFLRLIYWFTKPCKRINAETECYRFNWAVYKQTGMFWYDHELKRTHSCVCKLCCTYVQWERTKAHGGCCSLRFGVVFMNT